MNEYLEECEPVMIELGGKRFRLCMVAVVLEIQESTDHMCVHACVQRVWVGCRSLIISSLFSFALCSKNVYQILILVFFF